MALKTVVSAGSKVDQWADKPVLKLGAQNTMKLNRKALEFLGATLGMFAYIAEGSEPNQFYIGVSKEEELGGLKGAKIGIVGDKNEFSEATYTQLQFNSAVLGKTLYKSAATCEVGTEGEVDDDTSEGRTPTGLTFYELQMVETRAEADSRLSKNKPAKASEKEGAVDAGDADTDSGSEGDVTESPEDNAGELESAGESTPTEGRAARRR